MESCSNEARTATYADNLANSTGPLSPTNSGTLAGQKGHIGHVYIKDNAVWCCGVRFASVPKP